MTAIARIKLSEATRMFRAAKTAGWTRVRVTVDPAGNIVADASNESPADAPPTNPLDRVLR